jgi:hypothetical protein
MTAALRKQQLVEAGALRLKTQTNLFQSWRADAGVLRPRQRSPRPNEAPKSPKLSPREGTNPSASIPAVFLDKVAPDGADGSNAAHVSDVEEKEKKSLDQRLDEIIAIAPESPIIPTILFAQIQFFVLQGRLPGAEELARKMIERFPDRSESEYALALALSAQQRKDEALQAAIRGRNLSGSQRDLPDPDVAAVSGELMMRLAVHVKGSKQDGMRQSVKSHGEAVSAFSGGRCQKCDVVYHTPTPQWMCVKCWPQNEVLIWEPDTKGSCGVCGTSVGKFSRHHCRSCGKVVCGQCSNLKAEVPILNYEAPVRVCKACYPLLHESRTTSSRSLNSPTRPQPQAAPNENGASFS